MPLPLVPPTMTERKSFLRIPEPPQQRPGARKVVVQGADGRAPALPVGQGVEVFSWLPGIPSSVRSAAGGRCQANYHEVEIPNGMDNGRQKVI